MDKHRAWLEWLAQEKEKDYYKDILKRLTQLEKKTLIFPEASDYLHALEFKNIEDIKVIITESRPMVEPYAADGLAWSSLDLPTREMQLMYRRIYDELGVSYNQFDHSKERWAKQGVLLLPIELTSTYDPNENVTLWEEFTFSVLQALLNSPQKRFFLFLDEQRDWRVLSNPHGHEVLETNIRVEGEPIFQPINRFVSRHYGSIIDWS